MYELLVACNSTLQHRLETTETNTMIVWHQYKAVSPSQTNTSTSLFSLSQTSVFTV